MKHLYEYEDEEIKSMMTDLEGVGHGSLKGWLISCSLKGYHNASEGSCYLCIGATDVREAMSLYATFLGDVYGFPTEILKEALKQTKDDSFSSLGEAIFSSDSTSDEEPPSILNVWKDLIPNSKNSFIEEFDTNNIIFTLDELKKQFKNLESVLRSNKIGNYE
jgi:hypothetical protein